MMDGREAYSVHVPLWLQCDATFLCWLRLRVRLRLRYTQ